MLAKSNLLPIKGIAIFIALTCFSPLLEASKLNCSLTFSTSVTTPADQELIDNMLTKDSLRQAHELMSSLGLKKKDKADIFLKTIAQNNVKTLVELSQILAIASQMGPPTALKIVDELRQFKEFRKHVGDQNNINNKAIFKRLLIHDREHLRQLKTPVMEWESFVDPDYNKNIIQHRALVLMSYIFQPLGVLGQYATYETANQLQYNGDQSETNTINIIINSFQKVHENFIKTKVLTYKQTKTYLKKHIELVKALLDRFEPIHSEPINAARKLNHQALNAIETLAQKFPKKSQKRIKSSVVSAEVHKSLPYNKDLAVLDSAIDLNSDLFHFWSEIEHLLNEIDYEEFYLDRRLLNSKKLDTSSFHNQIKDAHQRLQLEASPNRIKLDTSSFHNQIKDAHQRLQLDVVPAGKRKNPPMI